MGGGILMRLRTQVVAVAVGAVMVATAGAASAATSPAWVDAWGAAPHSSAAETAVPTFANQTLRLIVHLHAGGNSVRVRLANTFGDRAVTFGRVSVGVRTGGAAVGSAKAVAFGGKASVTVAKGGESVVDEGIAGNKVLTDDPRSGVSALHRLTRDVLVRRGLRHVILLEGINDLRDPVKQATADQIIAGYQQIIDRVHAKHAKIF